MSAETYNRIVREARQQSLSDLVPKTSKQLGQELVKALDTSFQGVDGVEEFVQAWRTAMAEFAREGEARVRAATRLMIQRMEEAHREAAREVLEDPELRQQLEEEFADFPDQAYAAMWARRNVGNVGEFESLRRWGGSAQRVSEILQQRVGEGESFDSAASRLMAGLVQGDEQLEQIARDYGPGGGLTRDALNRGVDYDPEAAQIARQIGNDARRISRTEHAAAYHEADRQAAIKSPAVKGLKWTLSSAHSVPDECDVLAGQDVYGLGEGVYPPESLPPLPHPNCSCSTRMELWEPSNHGSELQDVPEPSLPTSEDVGDVSDAVANRASERARETILAA